MLKTPKQIEHAAIMLTSLVDAYYVVRTAPSRKHRRVVRELSELSRWHREDEQTILKQSRTIEYLRRSCDAYQETATRRAAAREMVRFLASLRHQRATPRRKDTLNITKVRPL